ncbi:uncharacterized protein LOC110092067, partial [Dendrobium catenatum]|uniref:uncharacterized protein LOC110092067 n=1 Tax=Dendrobium catenatum TaxID=906689 RepID=UPI00109EF40B
MNSISALFWNCRGARKKQTGYYLRSLVSNNEVYFVGLTETMIEDVNRFDVDGIIRKNWDFLHVPASGRSGGLLALWKWDVVHFEACLMSISKDYHSRRALWNDIGSLINAEDPVLVGGDFNCCLAQEEKKGGRCFTYSAGAQEMANFMTDNDLHDLGFSGPKFTWSNNKSGSSKIWVRLDRVLMNSEGLRLAPMASVKHLIRLASDHCPLLVSLDSTAHDRGSKWLRFEDIWLTYPATWKLVWKNWTKADFGDPDDNLNQKCSRTLRALFYWSRNRLKELGELKSTLEDRIAWLQEVECSSVGLIEEQDVELRRVAGELIATLARLATWWRQRAKTRWIEWKERQLSLNDWLEFREGDKIPSQFCDVLEADVTEMEVQKAVFSLGNNRSLGSDGITASFLKFYWEIIKGDVTRAIIHFFCTNTMCESWKETLVVLIPKTVNANQPAKFRPISLCQSFYKVVAKVLINRLKPVLSAIIGEEQGAFVPGRSIISHGLIAQEVMGKFKVFTQKSGLMALKVDMEQAYDCVAWETLEKAEGVELGIQVARQSERISHLLYADDILIFAEASRYNAKLILKLLAEYCNWTGQRINCGKSTVLFNRKCPRWRQRLMARSLGFRRVHSFDYLGLPMVLHRLNKADFGGLIKGTQEKSLGDRTEFRRHLEVGGNSSIICMSGGIPMSLRVRVKLQHHLEIRRNSSVTCRFGGIP